MALPNNKKRKIFDGRYEVISIVGRGTDSVVYHARHAASPTQEVALKVLLSQKDRASVTERLRKEALTLVSCRHRYVVRLDDFHSIGELCYLSMEYAPEGDLRKYIAKLGAPLQPDVAERFLRQCLEAIDFVHATGVVHRDIKPDNILVLSDREIRVADFGLALLPGDEPSIEELRSGVGSFGYLPPEALEGTRYDQRSDLYALGLCFYEVLTGTHPFDQAPLAMQMDVRADEKVPALHEINNAIPLHLSAVIGKLLKFEAEERFQSALEALKALNNPDAAEALLEQKSTTESAGDMWAVGGSAAPVVAEPSADADDDIIEKQIGNQLSRSANVDEPISVDEPKGSEPLDIDELEDLDEIIGEDDTDAAGTGDDNGERIPQPTEKIDLERIKEIIAKDAKQKAEAASRRAARERAAAQAAQKAHASNGGKPRPAPPPAVSPSKKKGDRGTSSGVRRSLVDRTVVLFGQLPRPLRLVAVGLAAAVLTIGLVLGLQFLPIGGPTEVGDSTTGESTEVVESNQGVPSEVPQLASGEQVFPSLPGGMYAGKIEGVIPGATSPLTLISLPNQGMLAVLIGVEGWSPVMVPASVEPGSPAGTVVIRTNGVILNITGGPGSDTIEGTFSNAVTGESGVWSVRRVS